MYYPSYYDRAHGYGDRGDADADGGCDDDSGGPASSAAASGPGFVIGCCDDVSSSGH